MHPEAKTIKQIISDNGFSFLYHFTDIHNLTSIGTQGLLTKAEIEKKSLMEAINFGGNELSRDLDLKYGNWDKVSLSWLPKIPMAYHREGEFHLCYLVLDPNLALAKNVVFTDMNATDKKHKRDTGEKGLSLVNFSSVRRDHPYRSELEKKQKQAEILIPFSISNEFIRAIAFRSEASLMYGHKICKKDAPDLTRKFVIESSIFHLPSPYINRYSFSGVEADSINRHMLESWSFTNKLNFAVNEDACIILEVSNSTPGIHVTVIVGRAELFSRQPFKGGSTNWTFAELPTSSPGKFVVEVLIEDSENSITQFFETIEVS